MPTQTPSSALLHAFDDQDKIFASAFSILREAITKRAFPAASVSVTHQGRLIALKAFGSFTYEGETEARVIAGKLGAPLLADFATHGKADADAVSPATLFDLASLTKVIATTPMAMLLYERGLLDLEAPVCAIVPEFISEAVKDPRRNEVTLRTMLTHSSGLPAYEKIFLKANTRDELLQAVFAMPLTADPATRAVYSDIGFILLGIALERLADESLDRFCQREIFSPLGMTNTAFNPPAEIRNRIPPTQDDETFRQKIIQGEVQDENASVLGGVASHAGLFSAAEDIAKFAAAICVRHFAGEGARATLEPRLSSVSQYAPEVSQLFRPETVALFTRREPAPPGTSRALGWDTPSAPSQSGKYFSPNSHGHLGYTGTSLWIDPTRNLSITLLTNRTWPDCSNPAIKQIRPKFHDAVVEALGSIKRDL